MGDQAPSSSSSSSSSSPSSPTFIAPTKKITNPAELQAFHRSASYKNLVSYIQRLGSGVEGRANSFVKDADVSPQVARVNDVLAELSRYIDEIPPIPQPMRYGNKAFRLWQTKLAENVRQLHTRILPPELADAAVELAPYFLDSFGNSTRIDYGTGHELHFVAWTYCLRTIGVLQETDELAIVLNIFAKYLTLVRKLQKVYGLEPAGSHGVWSLDDYQFIPFIWGAFQLTGSNIKPSDAVKPEVAEKYADEYLYLGCIHYIFTVKKGPFHEHSPDLFNISGAASWNKISTGMLRKFQDDVLAKVPIMQHFLFGSIFRFP